MHCCPDSVAKQRQRERAGETHADDAHRTARMFAHPLTNFAQFADDGTACRERGTFEVRLGAGLKIAGEEAVLTRFTEQERHRKRTVLPRPDISPGRYPQATCPPARVTKQPPARSRICTYTLAAGRALRSVRNHLRRPAMREIAIVSSAAAEHRQNAASAVFKNCLRLKSILGTDKEMSRALGPIIKSCGITKND